MRPALLLAAALLCGFAGTSSAAAEADSAAATTSTAAQQPEKPAEKVVCKREQTVGTRLSHSLCLTRSQWKLRAHREEESKSRAIDKINSKASDPLPRGSGG